ncbi:hypothetical protein EUX98_g9281 [Antrodiella citrinella]|uniref:Uncharacterized protein n=1 Tax=Antrodiella citrinella TaxID=2447956 RepID=A0A4S4LVL1_9APHY|nr:hypothetical protein EUX98_g9281 [Antrodiella citrinella]
MWGFYWGEKPERKAQPINTLSVLLYEYVALLFRWHFHGDLRDIILDNEPAKVIDLFDRYHFVVLSDYTLDLRLGSIKWNNADRDVPLSLIARAFRKLNLIEKLDRIAQDVTNSGRPWTRKMSGQGVRRAPKTGEVGQSRTKEVWGSNEGEPFKYFLQQEHINVSGPDYGNFRSHNGRTPEERDHDRRESEWFVLQTHQELIRRVQLEIPPNAAFTLPALARYDISVFEEDRKLSYFVNEVEWTPRMALWYYEHANFDQLIFIADGYAASIWDMCAGGSELRERWVDSLLEIEIDSRYG